MNRIAYTKPSITELEIRYATDAVTNGWGERCYEYIGKFEHAFRSHLGVKPPLQPGKAIMAVHLYVKGAQCMSFPLTPSPTVR